MGLDMHLTQRPTAEAAEEYKRECAEAGGQSEAACKAWATNELAYWCKANAIHGWFVKNIQGGIDDCGEYPVSREQLVELLQDCKTVLCAKECDAEDGGNTARLIAWQILPPCSGFFFGSAEIDDDYWEDLEGTVTKLAKVLADPTIQQAYYGSSW